MFKIFISLLFVSSNVMAGLPPTTVKGQSESSPTTTFNIQAPYYHATTTAPGTRLIESMNFNLLQNASFEHQTYSTGWTFTTGTPAADTTNFIDGKKGVSITLSAQTGDLLSQSITPSPQLSSQNLEHSIWVKTMATTIQVCALNAGVVVSSCLNVTGDGVWHKYLINAIGPSSGTIGLKVVASASTTGAVYIDQGYVGIATNIGTVAQARLIGQVKITGCAGSWTTTSASLAAFSAQTGCTYTVLQGSGIVSAPGTMIPGIAFSSLPPGNYVLKYEGSIGVIYTSALGTGGFQFWDGTNTANETSWVGNASSSAAIASSGIQQTISYSTTQSNVTLSIRGQGATGLSAYVYGTTASPGVISVYWYPTQSQQAISSNTTPTYAAKTWFGTGATTNLVGASAAASTTRTNLSAATLATYTRFGNAVDDASTNYQVTTTLPAGVYEVKFQGRLAALSPASATAATGCVFEIYDGTSAVASVYATALPNNYGAGGETVSSIAGYISLASPTTKTFIVRAAKINGDNNVNAYCFSSVDSAATMSMLSITPIGYVLPMPILVGSVTSNSAGAERQERVKFSNGASASCSSTPCTIDSQSGSWITGVTRSATGTYSIAIATGMFTAAPTCVCTAYDTAAAGYSTSCSIGSTTTSSISVGSYRSGVGMTDSIVSIQCMGPR